VSLTGEAFDQFFEQARYACLDEDEQRIYDRSLMDYWDIYAIEQTHYNEGLEKGKELGIAEGKELGIAEGKELGRQEGALQMLISLVRDGILSIDDAARKAGMSETAFMAAMDK
jgi:flagellar biosynthesis/type III secretory pathway protein FliH